MPWVLNPCVSFLKYKVLVLSSLTGRVEAAPKSRFDEQLGSVRVGEAMEDMEEMAEKSGAWLYVRLTPLFIFQSPELMSSWAASEWEKQWRIWKKWPKNQELGCMFV